MRFIAVLAAPFLLAGCGAPIAVQVASLFADGISLVTTDKTLTDHGISAIAGQDCAVWRGVKGEEICLEEKEDSLVLAEADASHSAPAPGEQSPDYSDAHFPSVGEEKPALSRQPKNPITRVAWKNPDEQPVEAAPPSPIVTSILHPLPARTPVGVAEPASGPEIATSTEMEIKGGTFYVIASFRRSAAANRFSSKHSRLKARVLEGTASGKTVFRVAIGPVVKSEMRVIRNRLIISGFKDTWAVKIKQPKVSLELAVLH